MPPRERQALSYALSATLLWSTVATAFKLALGYQPVIVLLTGASITSCVILGIVLLGQRRFLSALTQLRSAVGRRLLLASINPIAYYLVLFEAYRRLPAQVAQPVNYTWAITFALLSVPLLGHRLGRSDLVGLVLGGIGVTVISIAGRVVTGEIDPVGLILALGSTALWAGFWLLNTRTQDDAVAGLFLNFLLASPVLVLVTWLLPHAEVNWQPAAVFSVIYVGLFEMGITFLLWQLALQKTGHAARIASMIFLSPFISLLLISLVLGEPLQWQTFAGLSLIVVGVALTQSSRAPARARDSRQRNGNGPR